MAGLLYSATLMCTREHPNGSALTQEMILAALGDLSDELYLVEGLFEEGKI